MHIHLETQARTKPDADIGRELENVVDTVIKPIVRRKLHVTLITSDTRERNHDALDLVGDVRVILLSEVSRSASTNGAIRDLASYAATVTANACYQYFRTRFPERTRLRNKLRYILTHDAEFALWKNTSDRWECGLASWGDAAEYEVPKYAKASRGGERDLTANDMRSFFEEIARPVAFDDLVDHIAEVRGINEPFELTDDSGGTYPDPAPRVDTTVENASRLSALWNAVQNLPAQHRKALLLNLRDSSGDNLLVALPLSGIATLREIAVALEMSLEQLVDTWSSLPWDDTRIAAHLQLTRQQVINLRQTARAKLTRWKKETGNI